MKHVTKISAAKADHCGNDANGNPILHDGNVCSLETLLVDPLLCILATIKGDDKDPCP